ncbi:Uncharacterised protein [Mycobacteroides abscessus]|nr:Uncharacterised protein [Mycobacteroides abscessus]SLD58543.1 Uncharacterised protein [Mycobacteroides abscessus subsp. massiliense]
MNHTIDSDTAVALRVQLFEQVDELALARAHHRCEYLEPQALFHIQHLIHDLLGCLLGDLLATYRAMRRSGACVQQTQIVVDLGDGAHGRPRVPVGRLLVDRDRRGKPLDEIDIGFIHLPQELPGVGRK